MVGHPSAVPNRVSRGTVPMLTGVRLGSLPRTHLQPPVLKRRRDAHHRLLSEGDAGTQGRPPSELSDVRATVSTRGGRSGPTPANIGQHARPGARDVGLPYPDRAVSTLARPPVPRPSDRSAFRSPWATPRIGRASRSTGRRDPLTTALVASASPSPVNGTRPLAGLGEWRTCCALLFRPQRAPRVTAEYARP